jgi:hypothetical protein
LLLGSVEELRRQLEKLLTVLCSDTNKTERVPASAMFASVEVASLLREIESSTSRISDLVLAIKEYTHMDQAPVQWIS